MRGFLPLSRIDDVSTCLPRSNPNAQSVSAHAKHSSTASSKERKNHLEPSVAWRAQPEVDSPLKRLRPHPPHKRAYFSPQPKLRFPEKNTMVRPNPNIQIESMMYENEAFVRGFLAIPKVEDVKTNLSCEASLRLQELKV